jgi:hypothetical protein
LLLAPFDTVLLLFPALLLTRRCTLLTLFLGRIALLHGIRFRLHLPLLPRSLLLALLAQGAAGGRNVPLLRLYRALRRDGTMRTCRGVRPRRAARLHGRVRTSSLARGGGMVRTRHSMRLCRALRTGGRARPSGTLRTSGGVRPSSTLRTGGVTAALGCRDFDFLLRGLWLRDRCRREPSREAERQSRCQTCCYFCHAESSTRERPCVRASWDQRLRMREPGALS